MELDLWKGEEFSCKAQYFEYKIVVYMNIYILQEYMMDIQNGHPRLLFNLKNDQKYSVEYFTRKHR